MRNKRKIQLSDHFDYQTLLRFTTPSVLMMVISSVYSIVDGLFISNFAGADGFAAVNLMMPIAMLISCLAFMAGAGGSALVSKTLGEHQEEKARRIFSLIVYLIAGFNIFAAAFFAALNNGFVSSILSVTRTFVFQLICVYTLPAIIGSTGIWLSVTAAEILSLAVTFTMFLKNRRKYGYW